MKQLWAGAISEHDVYLIASTVTAAPRSEGGAGSLIPQRLWTLSELLAISIPVAAERELPIGLQVVGQKRNEY